MPTIKNKYQKLRRNETCPCEENDGREKPKKYKQCCLKKIQAKEQQTYEMIYESKRIAEAKKHVAATIQHDIDHPILVPTKKIVSPSNIIIP
ncbi:hypothetical protein LCGC14_2051040 [marine sediment metagenome]|uniref:Uncharacterized protein n=1 Tax=marine sediment metagenome TaxID=412755 RepID=A0A0F9EP68_9ZZZZ